MPMQLIMCFSEGFIESDSVKNDTEMQISITIHCKIDVTAALRCHIVLLSFGARGAFVFFCEGSNNRLLRDAN